VKEIAGYKPHGTRKIELFYFFANSWFARARAGIRNMQILKDWWGRDDWKQLFTWKAQRCLDEMVDRFRSELRYWSVKPWPIFKDPQGRSVMYWMVHATDHEKAPDQMTRAYNAVGLPKEVDNQLGLFNGLPIESQQE
jgi:three-Cys-motif partner protein